MVVGADFDNTIVCCDGLFHRAALERGLIPVGVPDTKTEVREQLRRRGQEDAWTELQGYVYGALLRGAPAFPGVLEFFARCRQQGARVCIISHRTRYPYVGEAYDLHAAAHDWLKDHGFYDPNGIGLSVSAVFFEATKQEKLDRIARIGCSHFIDDLPELLMDPGFPSGVQRVLFDPNCHHPSDDRVHRAGSWTEIEQWLMGVGASG